MTADGEQIFVGLTSDGHWRRFCEQFHREDLLQDPAYTTNEDRVRARPVLRPLVAEIVARHKLAELAELFDRIVTLSAPSDDAELDRNPHERGTDRKV